MIDVFEELAVNGLVNFSRHTIGINVEDGNAGFRCGRAQVQCQKNDCQVKDRRLPFEYRTAYSHIVLCQDASVISFGEPNTRL